MIKDKVKVFVLADHTTRDGTELHRDELVEMKYLTDDEREEVNALAQRGVVTLDLKRAQAYREVSS